MRPQNERQEGLSAAWTLVGIVIFFKLGTAGLILLYAQPTSAAYGLLFANNWPLVIPLALLLAGPAVFWHRLVRLRARRKALRRSEWIIAPADEPSPVP